MCSTVAPMARGGRGDITGNVPGQGFTSPSPCTHVQGAYGAPTGAVGGAADGRRSMRKTSLGTPVSVSHAVFRGCRIQHIPLSEAASKSRARKAFWGPENVLRMLATTVSSTPDNEAMAHVRTYASFMTSYVLHCCSHG